MAKGGKGGGSGKGGSGKGSGRSGGTSMSKSDSARIQSAGTRTPDSATAKSGFDERAQSAADRNQSQSEKP